MKQIRRRSPQRRSTSSAFPKRPRRDSNQHPSFTATEAKNEFGRILEKAIQGQTVVITRHHAPKAVLISVDQFNALKHAPELKLDVLSRDFDVLLARMQTSKARAGMKAAFGSSPQQLGEAAVLVTRKRG
jgi:prevent-host-death family protein